ncbi:hypothetical protein Taro_039554 [Colocasia esculenta]|uniref:Uncharacterized protein n=1 Tax=Colocasia esculenta TaxID=4460 RepID=A0A843WGX1_COLES|nr:hypothetical protein [Colocasia esculenta]
MPPKQTPKQGARSRATAPGVVIDEPPTERRSKRCHDLAQQQGLSSPSPTPSKRGTTFSCKGSVDTTISGVDTMAQSKGRNVKKRSTSVDTRPGQVDTSDRSQRNKSTDCYSRSTLDGIRSTLESLPRRPVLQMPTAGRHYSISGRH